MSAPSPLANLPNPFAVTVVVDAWSLPFADVESIHQRAFETCLAALARVARGEPDSVLIAGVAGSGKTHLLARVQRHLHRTAPDAPDRALHCVFVSAKLQTSSRAIWRFVRRRFVDDLFREHEGVSQLVRLIAHQIAASRGEPVRRWVQGVRVVPAAADDISELVDRVAEPLGLGRGLGIVIGHLVHRRHVADASAWLRGESLPEATLATLGVSSAEPDDREDDARQVVTALCRLASESLPIVFCFDQIEAVQSSPDDTDSLFRFGRMVAELSEADANVLVISAVQSALVDRLEASVRGADADRAFRHRASLTALDRDQIRALVRSRLDGAPALRALRAQHPAEPDYPFSAAFVKSLDALPVPVPRKVFAVARDELARLQGQALRPDPPDPETFLGETFTSRREAALAAGIGDSDSALLHGLPLLWDVSHRVLHRAKDTDVDFVVDGPTPLMVAVCNESNMTSLAARLRRLLAPGEGQDALRILRDPRRPISRSAKKAQEYLRALEGRGARVIAPSQEALAALEALRTLLSDARSGDLACHGDTLGEATVRGWLGAHLAPALVDLVEQITATGGADGDGEMLRALCDLLSTAPVGALDAIAAELVRDPQAVLECARRAPDEIGVLVGPPTVLFARLPAERAGHEESP